MLNILQVLQIGLQDILSRRFQPGCAIVIPQVLMVCLRSLSIPEQWTFTIACDPRCKWGVRGDHRSCVWGNYVLTCMCWHVAVKGSVPCLVPRMSEAVWLCRMGRRYSVVKLLGGLCAFVVVVVKMVVGTVCWLLFCGCVSWALYGGVQARSSSCLAAELQSLCVVKWLVALCSLLVFVIACYLGSV